MVERAPIRENKRQRYYMVVLCRKDWKYYPIRLGAPPHSAKENEVFSWDATCFKHNTERERIGGMNRFVPHPSQSVFVTVEDFPNDPKRMENEARSRAKAIYEAPLKKTKLAKKKHKR